MAFSEAARSDPALEMELRRLTVEVAAQNQAVLAQWRQRGWRRTDVPFSALVLRATAIGALELWARVIRLDGHSREEYVELVGGVLLDGLMTAGGLSDELARPSESEPV